MVTGDEPQLGGQPDTDAPMISGQATKAMTDARGAYLAGNLDAIIERMSEAQQRQFRRALVEQSARLLEPVMPAENQDVGEHTGLRFARLWLADPDSVELDRWVFSAQADIYDGGVRNFNYGEEVFAPIFAAAAKNLSLAAVYAISAARYGAQIMLSRGAGNGQISEVSEQAAARRWQVEAAWAILQGKEPPAPIDAELSEAERLYRAGGRDRLVGLMNSAQQTRFRQAVVGQAIAYAEAVLPAENHDRGERRFLAAARRWLNSPGVESDQALTDVIGLPTPSLPRREYDVFHASRNAARSASQPDLCEAAQHAYASAAGASSALGHQGHALAEAQKSVWRWQVEAAWAILHDQDPPPLTLGLP